MNKHNACFLFSPFYKLLIVGVGFFIPHFLFAQNDSTNHDLAPIEIRSIINTSSTPMRFSNLDKNFLTANNQTQDVPFVLQQSSSVVAYSDAGNGVGYTGLRLRGSDLTRINVTINGVPYNDAEGQGVYFVNIPDIVQYAQNVQIQRGVGSSTNGGSAFGGGIHFSTTNLLNDTASVTYSLSVASCNTFKQNIVLHSGALGKKFYIDLAASRNTSDGYIDRAFSTLSSGYASMTFLASTKTQLKLNYLFGQEKTYHAWNGVIDTLLSKQRTFNSAGLWIDSDGAVIKDPPYKNQTDNYTQHHFQFLFSTRINAKFSFNNTVFTSLGKGYYEEYKNGKIPSSNDVSIAVVTDYIRQLWLDNIFYGNLFSLHYGHKNTNIYVGINAQRYEGKHFGYVLWADQFTALADTKTYDLHAYKNDFNGFVKYTQNVNKHLSLYADIQLRSVDYRMNGFRNQPDTYRHVNYFFVNPKVGLSYQTKYLQGFASYSVGQKEPNRNDFENRRDIAQPEFLHDIEIGNTWTYKKIQYTNTLFGMYYKNQLVLDGSIDDVGNYLRQNISQSYRMGIENEFVFTILPHLQLTGNFTWSSNKIVSYEDKIFDYDANDYQRKRYTHTNLSFSPSLIGAYQISYTPIKNVSLFIKGKYVGQQYLDNTSDDTKSLSAYYVQDLAVRLIWQKKKQYLTIEGGVNNVLNRLYEANGYVYAYYSGRNLSSHNYYFPMIGVNYFIKTSVHF